MTALIGGLIGATSCMLLAVFARTLNLGLLGNIVIGFVVGELIWLLIPANAIANVALVALTVATALGTMTAIGLYLNARAR